MVRVEEFVQGYGWCELGFYSEVVDRVVVILM